MFVLKKSAIGSYSVLRTILLVLISMRVLGYETRFYLSWFNTVAFVLVTLGLYLLCLGMVSVLFKVLNEDRTGRLFNRLKSIFLSFVAAALLVYIPTDLEVVLVASSGWGLLAILLGVQGFDRFTKKAVGENAH